MVQLVPCSPPLSSTFRLPLQLPAWLSPCQRTRWGLPAGSSELPTPVESSKAVMTHPPGHVCGTHCTSRSASFHFWLKWVGLLASLTIDGTRPTDRSFSTTSFVSEVCGGKPWQLGQWLSVCLYVLPVVGGGVSSTLVPRSMCVLPASQSL